MSMQLQKWNPSTGQVLAEYEIAPKAVVEQAVQRSQNAQQQWQKTSLKQRSRLLKAIANQLYREADAFAQLISDEVGKPMGDSKEADLGGALSILNYYAEVGPAVLKPRRIQPDLMSLLAGRNHQEVFHPRGVIGIISPWNYPLVIPVSGIAASLMAGNTVVLKPSELTPGTAERLVRLIQKVSQAQGFSHDLVQVVIGDGTTGAALVDTPVDGIIFTGSERVGHQIAQKAAERNVWYSLELGGSDAMIVLDSCDLEQIASYALWGRFTNAGQACAAVKRLLIPQEAQERFIEILQEKVSQLRVGAPDEPGCHYGPLISEGQLSLLEGQVQDALDCGATLLTGGKHLNRPGFFYEPTLFSNVPTQARILKEEVFGPVLPILPYQRLEDAIALANQQAYGLTASVFGDPEKAQWVASQLACATVTINDTGASNYAMSCAPWGGWKKSGHGVSHGKQTLQELSQRQIISQNQRFRWPLLNKPLWLFGQPGVTTDDRASAVMAFANRHPHSLNPFTWLAFWKHRSTTRL